MLAALDRGIQERYAPGQKNHDYAAMMQNDEMDYRSLGLFALPTEQWANKPTQQQFIEFKADRTSLAAASTPPVVASGGMPLTSRAPAVPWLFALGALVLLAGLVLRPRRRSG